MARNIEIKARLADRAGVVARAEALATEPPAWLEQDDTFFAAPHGRLKLRCMPEGAELIAYRRPDAAGPKLSQYWRVAVPEPDAMRELLTQAMGSLGRVRKRRLLVMAGRTRIHIDQVEGLGDYLELEVVLRDDEPLNTGEAQAQELLQRLQVPLEDLVSTAYLDLLAAKAAKAAKA